MAGGLHPPLSLVTTWTPNYVDPETSGSGIIILVAVLLGLCYIVVFMRLWARMYLAKNAGIDDALIVFNMVCSFNRIDGSNAYHAKVPLTGLAVSLILGEPGLNSFFEADADIFGKQLPTMALTGMFGIRRLLF
jgi:hypothetical protein